jgi:hypothetical protein
MRFSTLQKRRDSFCIAGGCGGTYGDDAFLSVLGKCVENISE